MEIPEGLKYSKEHEWVLVEGQSATIGITEYAQEELGDIVYVELPEVGEKVVKDDPFGDGWIIRVELSDPDDLKDLMDADEYAEYVAQQKEENDEEDEDDEEEDEEEEDEEEK